MPFIRDLAYQPNFIFQNGHISTIYYGLLNKFKTPDYRREELTLPDNDFILLDSFQQGKENALILCHGLEGDSRKNYNNVTANYFIAKDFSIFAWNNRSCGGEMNRSALLYHHDGIDELEYVVKHVEILGYKNIYIIGFSLGGAQTLNVLGKRKLSGKVKAAVAISAPYDLRSSSTKIQEGLSQIYLTRFIRKIRSKILQKAAVYPDLIDHEIAKHIKDFNDVINDYIIPAHGGYSDLDDYFVKASPAYAIEAISIPVLIINAMNDPILGEKDHPVAMAEAHDYVFLETPDYGGHCAFPMPTSDYPYSVLRAYEFFEQVSW